ncbi:MAG TPA: hypothetical protein VNT51_06950 [Miltoncostaeaceae bacterium]|nr:hypothetical protein [Miltoncostaeaceae bacterium]
MDERDPTTSPETGAEGGTLGGTGERAESAGRGTDPNASPQVGRPEGGSSTDDPRNAERYGP